MFYIFNSLKVKCFLLNLREKNTVCSKDVLSYVGFSNERLELYLDSDAYIPQN